MTHEEQLEKLVEKRKALQESIRSWQALIDHEAFRLYQDRLRAEIRTKRNADFNTLVTNLDVAFQSTGLRAEIAALQRAIYLPQSEIEDLEGQIVNINTELEQWSEG